MKNTRTFLKKSIFQFNKKIFKTVKRYRNWYWGNWGKFAPPYAIIFMADLEKRILKYIELKPRIW